jgi:hypothetical protein
MSMKNNRRISLKNSEQIKGANHRYEQKMNTCGGKYRQDEFESG